MNNTTPNTMNNTTRKTWDPQDEKWERILSDRRKRAFAEIRTMAKHATACTERPDSTIDVLLDDLKPAMYDVHEAVAYEKIERAYMQMTEAMSKFHSLVYQQVEVQRTTCTQDEAMEVILNEDNK